MDPRQHPLWPEQVALETEMVQRGADHYREMVAKARDPGAAKGKDGKYPPEMTRLLVYRRAMVSLVQGMGDGLKEWLRNHAKRPGASPAGFYRMQGMDPYVVAFITVRQIMDSASVQKLSLMTVARSLGLAIEQEQRMNAWIAEEPALWAEVQKGLKEQKATDDHRHKVNINRFNTLVRDKIAWQDWAAEERLHVGFNCVDVLTRTTKDIVVVEEDGCEKSTAGKKNGRMIVRLSDELTKHIAKGLTRDEMMYPQYMPTLMPPKRWEGIRQGGYYTKFVRVPWLIRFHADSAEVKQIAAEEYDSLDMPRVFEAVRLVQETPWRINKRVLSVALTIWDRDLGIAGIDRRDPSPLPPKTPAIEKALKEVKAWERVNYKGLDAEGRKAALEKMPRRLKAQRELAREWRTEAARVYGENARRISHTTAARQTIELAMKFKDREFYFPHMLDFRGRMYPIPMYLQPQGHDLARGLLTFANGKPVMEKDAGWLAIHLANCWGNDKISFDERIEWVEAQRPMWLRIADNPMASLEWANRDDPWQTLAAILEWVRYLCEGPGMISSLPIRVDGTCNGIQHLASMMRDEVAGAEVNLIPSSTPKDIYGTMGRALSARLEGIREGSGLPGQRADWWLQRFPDGIPRSLPKNPVMVLPYGGTRDSYFGSIHKWLQKNDPKGTAFPEKQRREMVPFMRDCLWDTVAGGEVMGKVMECMEWLKEVADIVAATEQPIFWTTPTGFHVRHFYGAEASKRIDTKIDGKSIRLRLTKRTNKLAKREQLQGISPNFVHSMDASANMETILLFHEANADDPPAFTSIHDAYGTVAGSMWSLYDCLREAFVKVHTHDVLEDFRDRCVLMYRDHLYAHDTGKSLELCWEIAEDTIKRVPKRGNLDITAVKTSDYFFA